MLIEKQATLVVSFVYPEVWRTIRVYEHNDGGSIVLKQGSDEVIIPKEDAIQIIKTLSEEVPNIL